jgi:tetratricopeptide (TPR) repeat protein
MVVESDDSDDTPPSFAEHAAAAASSQQGAASSATHMAASSRKPMSKYPTYHSGCKIAGAYCIVTIREPTTNDVDNDDGTTTAAPPLRFRAYNPQTCVIHNRDIDESDVVSLLADVPALAMSWRQQLVVGGGESVADDNNNNNSGGGGLRLRAGDDFYAVLLERIVAEIEANTGGGGGGSSTKNAPPPPPPPPSLQQLSMEEEEKDNIVTAESNAAELTRLSEEAQREQAQGTAAFTANEFDLAHTHHSKAAALEPTNLLHRLSCAEALLALGQYAECASVCKTVVSAGRAVQQRMRKLTSESTMESMSSGAYTAALERASAACGGVSASASIARAYAQLGDCYSTQGKGPRAINCYLLSLKAQENADVRTRMAGVMQTQQQQQQPGGAAPPPPPSSVQNPPSAADIESLLENHDVLSWDSNFKFECT